VNKSADSPSVELVDLIKEESQLWRDKFVFIIIKDGAEVTSIFIEIFHYASAEG
jgi:hypothetical protein